MLNASLSFSSPTLWWYRNGSIQPLRKAGQASSTCVQPEASKPWVHQEWPSSSSYHMVEGFPHKPSIVQGSLLHAWSCVESSHGWYARGSWRGRGSGWAHERVWCSCACGGTSGTSSSGERVHQRGRSPRISLPPLSLSLSLFPSPTIAESHSSSQIFPQIDWRGRHWLGSLCF